MAVEADYSPIKAEQDQETPYTDDSESELLPRSSSSDHQWQTGPFAERRWNAFAVHAVLGLLNIIILIATAYLYSKSPYQRPGSIYCEIFMSVPVLQHN
jgi:hypothetical protein